jgi:hypothetical protein
VFYEAGNKQYQKGIWLVRFTANHGGISRVYDPESAGSCTGDTVYPSNGGSCLFNINYYKIVLYGMAVQSR